ncbi:cyanate hydratase [Synechococcus sp. AH-551-E05]|nr:cyanate hydratase [Synechococcus sp. AH-551-E05]MDB4651220.1 cyanate hydratase [Synechococcus sp. AH-551-E05]
MGQLLRSVSSLLNSKDSSSTFLTSLVLERLYYADGRHHPEHPNHGSIKGLTSFT